MKIMEENKVHVKNVIELGIRLMFFLRILKLFMKFQIANL